MKIKKLENEKSRVEIYEMKNKKLFVVSAILGRFGFAESIFNIEIMLERDISITWGIVINCSN